MDLHPGEELVFEGHPSWRALLAFYLTAILAIVVVVVVWSLVGSASVAVVVGLVLLAAVIAAGYVKRLATRYAVTTQRLQIKRGLLSRRVQQTRIERVQNVTTAQTVLQRVLRVGTVDFDTAGTDDSEFRFVGIENPSEVVEAVDRAQREALRHDQSSV